jgi:hypothetical protein
MTHKKQKGRAPEENTPPVLSDLQKHAADATIVAERVACALTFPVWQSHLVTKLGISLDDFRELRDQHLQRDVDWRFGPDNHIVLTEAAALHLAGIVLAVEKDGRQPAVLPASTLKPTEARLKVHRAGPLIPNPRLVEATLDQDNAHHTAGTVVIVRVRNNLQFRKGDEITARHHEGLFYDLTSGVPKRKV